MKKIGIIGNGFVGNSVAFGFSPTHEIRIHDKDPKKNLNTIKESVATLTTKVDSLEKRLDRTEGRLDKVGNNDNPLAN